MPLEARLRRARFRLEAAKVERAWAVVSAHRSGLSVRKELLASTPDPVRTYLKQISRVPLLTADQEVNLAMRIEASRWAEAMLQAPEPPDLDRALELTRRSHIDLEPAPPTPPEVREVCRQLVLDGRLARCKLVEANLRLVVSVAKRHAGRGVPLLDLIQEGNLRLLRAVEKFDYSRGFKSARQ